MVRAESIRLSAPGQEITATGSYDIEDRRGRFEWTIETENPAPLAVLLPPPPPGEPPPLWLPSAGSGVIAGTLHLGPEGPNAEVEIALADVRSPGLTATSALGSLRVSERWVEGMDVRFTRPGGELRVAGRIPLAAEGGRAPASGLDVRVAATAWPLGEARPWLPEALVDLPLDGSFTGELALSGDLEAPTGRVEGELARASYGGVELGLLRAGARLRPAAGRGAHGAAGEPGRGGDRLRHAPAGRRGARFHDRGAGPDLGRAAARRLPVERPHRPPGLRGRAARHARPPGRRGHRSRRATWRSTAAPWAADGSAQARVDWDGARLEAAGSLLGLAEVQGGGALDLERADLRFTVASEALREIVETATGRPVPDLTGAFTGEIRIAGAFAGEAPLTAALTVDPLSATYSGHTLRNREPVRVRLERGAVVVDSFYLVEPGTDSELFVGGRIGLGEAAALDLQLQASLAAAWLELVAPTLQMTGTFDALATVRGTDRAAGDQRPGRGARRAPPACSASRTPSRPSTPRSCSTPTPWCSTAFSSRLGGGALQAERPRRAAGGGAAARIPLPGHRPRRHPALSRGLAGARRRRPAARCRSPAGARSPARSPSTAPTTCATSSSGFTQLLRAALAQERVEVAETDELMVTTQLNLALTVPPGALRVTQQPGRPARPRRSRRCAARSPTRWCSGGSRWSPAARWSTPRTSTRSSAPS